MKKFVVIHTRKSLFRKNSISTFENVYDHAVDAYRQVKYLKTHNERDGRWPILSYKVILR